MKVTPLEEAQLRIDTVEMYKNGGVPNVMDAVDMMNQCIFIILSKLNEILDEEIKKGNIK